jgi:hypothetical protein
MADVPVRPPVPLPVDRPTTIAADGVIAGVLGAVTVAAWFLALDSLAGRPFYTPSVLGTALFRRGVGLDAPDALPISLEMVGMFTWVHALAFIALGGAASYLLAAVERRPSLGFGVLLFFVIFQACFTVAALIFAAQVLRAVGWIPILAANLLAASVMALYLGWRHREMSVLP